MAKTTQRKPAAGLEAAARWMGEELFSTLGTSGHEVVLDADRSSNRAPGPMEMVLRSLCACSATDIAIIFRKARQGLTKLEVLASAERAPEPPQVYTRIHLRYRIMAESLNPGLAERAVRLSQQKYCSVLAMLSRTAEVSHAIELTPAPPSTVGTGEVRL